MRKFLLRFFGLEKPNLIVRDETTRALPVIVGIVTFLLTMGMSLTFSLETSLLNWQSELTGTMSVQIVSRDEPGSGQVEKIQRRLEMIPGILSATPLSQRDAQSLFEDWLALGALPEDLKFPLIFDLALAPDADVSAEDVQTAISSMVKGQVLVDDHTQFLNHVRSFIFSVELAAWLTLALLFIAGAVVVSLATRAGMAVHRQVVEVLHLIGARDGYIASRFAWRAFYGSLLGAFLGWLGALVMISIILFSLRSLQMDFTPLIGWGITEYISLALLPLAVALLAKFISLWTVHHRLARMV